jgi:hypothetical protein
MDDPAELGIFPLIAKALMFPPPQTEAFERQDIASRRTPAKAPKRRRGLLERLDHWFWVQQQRDVEAYLAKASDVYDLETRIRQIDRNGFHPYY